MVYKCDLCSKMDENKRIIEAHEIECQKRHEKYQKELEEYRKKNTKQWINALKQQKMTKHFDYWYQMDLKKKQNNVQWR